MEGQIGTVRTGLIPALGGGSNGTERDGVPQHERSMPFVVFFVLESLTFIFMQRVDHVEALGVPGNESGTTEQVDMLRHAILFSEYAGILDSLLRSASLSGGSMVSPDVRWKDGVNDVRRTFSGFSTTLRATDARRSGTLSASTALFSL